MNIKIHGRDKDFYYRSAMLSPISMEIQWTSKREPLSPFLKKDEKKRVPTFTIYSAILSCEPLRNVWILYVKNIKRDCAMSAKISAIFDWGFSFFIKADLTKDNEIITCHLRSYIIFCKKLPPMHLVDCFYFVRSYLYIFCKLLDYVYLIYRANFKGASRSLIASLYCYEL